MEKNLIERMAGMLPPHTEMVIKNGSFGNVKQTVITIKDKKKSISGGIKWPHTDDDFYLHFIDTITLFKR
jgi:hypothetical protein